MMIRTMLARHLRQLARNLRRCVTVDWEGPNPHDADRRRDELLRDHRAAIAARYHPNRMH